VAGYSIEENARHAFARRLEYTRVGGYRGSFAFLNPIPHPLTSLVTDYLVFLDSWNSNAGLTYFKSTGLYRRRRRRRRMYYCGGPYKEQAGTAPTYTHPKYAAVINGPVAVVGEVPTSTYPSHEQGLEDGVRITEPSRPRGRNTGTLGINPRH
jgi:hypothetical protein